MKLHEISPAPGAVSSPKRLGRGIGSGLGKTSGKGHKGAKARSGGGKQPGFEGGQMPLMRRIPKRGFTNIWAAKYAVINVSALECFENGSTVTPESIMQAGLVNKLYDGVKILGNGELTKKLTVQAEKITKGAASIIENAGGKAEPIVKEKRTRQAKKDKKAGVV